MPDDLKDTDGKYRTHPKVYVGFFKHANLFDKYTRIEVFDSLARQDISIAPMTGTTWVILIKGTLLPVVSCVSVFSSLVNIYRYCSA